MRARYPLGGGVCLIPIQRCSCTFRAIHLARVLVTLFIMAPLFAASAQEVSVGSHQAVTTSPVAFEISGVILDPSNAAIAGAKVILRRRNIESQQATTTDSAGYFQFEGLTQDDYEIEVQQEGFKISQTRVRVGARAHAPLRIVLAIADLHEEITVANPQRQLSSETSENMDVIRLDRQTLDSLPIMDNDIVSAVKSMLGPGSENATLTVDGLKATEAGVPASAIQEVRINQNPYSAEFSAPGQNRIEVITKNGSSSYHGALNSTFRDYHLDARNAFSAERPPERHILLDGYFGGPLLKSKTTTFLLSANWKADDLQSVVYAQMPIPVGLVREDFPSPQRSNYFLAGLNMKISERNTLSVRYSFFDWRENGAGVGGARLPETASDDTSRKHYIFVSDRAVFTNKLVNEFSARLGTSDTSIQSVLQGAPSIVVLGAFTGGSGQDNKHEERDYLQITDMLSWSHGNHLVKAGVNVPELTRWGSNDRTNFDGTFQFSSLQDYLDQKPFSFVQQQGNGRLVYWQREMGFFIQDDVRVRRNLSVAFGLRYDWQNYVSGYRNFAPRSSFAWAPRKTRNIVFRGGAGVFYETTGPAAISDMLRYDGQTLRQIVLSNPGYPDPFSLGGAGQALPSSIVRFAPDLRLPYNVQYNFGIETQLQKSTTFTASYVGIRGFDLFRSRDINAPLPPLPLPPLQAQRPDPTIATLREIESAGNSQSDALKLTVRTRIGHFFDGMVQYTLGRSYDDTAGIEAFPANQYDLTGEWSRSNFDSRHFVYFYGTVNAPKNFRFGLSLSVRSGRPYTETTGTDDYETTFANARPPGVPRNSLEGPEFVALNLRLARAFQLHKSETKKSKKEGTSATLALDAFNVLNNVNLGQPVGNLSSPFFGLPISAGPARRLQASLGFQF